MNDFPPIGNYLRKLDEIIPATHPEIDEETGLIVGWDQAPFTIIEEKDE